MISTKQIGAIILAAGKGSRIGFPKLVLKIHDEFAVDIICRKLMSAGTTQICCIVVSKLNVSQFSSNHQICWTVNPHPENGMISSIFNGVQSLEKSDGYLIVPVDHPMFEFRTVVALVECFSKNPNCAVSPKYKNQSGHPMIIPYEIASKLSEEDYDGGLKQFLVDSNCDMIYVDVDDPGILVNINTKHDLERIKS